jgi:diguanylate cyclase (GGDEF)-like protein
MTLRRKLLLSLLLTLVPLVALGITTYVLVRDSLLDDARTDVELRARLRAGELERRLDVANGELESITLWPELAEPATAGDSDGLDAPLAAVATWWAQFRELAVVERDGTVLAATDAGYATRVEQPTSSSQTLGAPNLVDGRWVMSVVQPIGTAADVFVSGEIASDFLVPGGIVPADVADPMGAGAVIATGSQRRVIVFVADHESPEEAALVATRLASSDADLSGVKPVAGSQAFVAILANEDDVLGPLDRLRLAIAVALGLAIVVVLVLASILGRTIGDRIGRLRELTAAIGGGDWSRRVGDLRSDELGELSVSFDRMADQLASDNQRRRQIQDELSHQALHDPLTGLANRVKFLDRLNDALARSSRSGAPVAVLFCDLDNLKTVNDRLGHTAGDDLLSGVADRFLTSVRPSDTVARFGGDEFVVLCAEMAAPDDALVVADRLSAALVQPFDLAGEKVHSTASIGIAVGSGASATAEELVRDADAAMYAAKQGGKAHYVLHETSLAERMKLRDERSEEVKFAIRNGQLRLEYQPVVELETGRLVSVEAFVRWDHPDRGVVGPREMFSQLSEAGTVIDVDRWVIDEAVAQMAEWNRDASGRRRLPVTVNVSGEYLRSSDVVEHLGAALKTNGVDACQLQLEISEPLLTEDPIQAATNCDLLRLLGVGLVLDDFGTGHISLERLRRFGFSVLKIDGSIIEDIDRGGDPSPMLAALSLANTLDMAAVIEGVERVEQVPELLRHGVELAQGHLFCAPTDPIRLESWFDRLEL